MASITLAPTHDTYVQEGFPTTAASQAGNAAKLVVGYNGRDASNERRTWTKWNTASIAGATGITATLRTRPYFSVTVDYGSQEIGAYRATGTSWDEATMTWNTAPTIDGSLLDSNYFDSSQGIDWDFDVTAAVVATLGGDLSLVLKPVSVGAFSDLYEWLMQDADYTVGPPAQSRPQLIIDYTPAVTFRPQTMMIM